jgi:hypothetical protein
VIIIPEKQVISMKEKLEEKIGNKRGKRPYEKPLFRSEELFETAVLACTKRPQACVPGPVHDT